MAENSQFSVSLKPLLFGRLTRVVVGLLALLWAASLWRYNLINKTVSLVMLFLGLSFLVGGLVANPGCEITALLNLVRRPEKRVHMY